MSVPAAARQPAPHSALRRLVAGHPVASFLAMVYTVNSAVALVPFLTIMWLYNNTGYSVLLVGMFHSSFNVTTSAFGPFIPREMSFLVAISVVAVAAVLIVVFTRGRLSYVPAGSRTAS